MPTITEDVTEGIERVITGVGDQSAAALESVRGFVDAVNRAIPDMGESALRSQIIDSAFAMTRQVVETSGRFAVGIVDSTGRVIEGIGNGEAARAE